MLSETEKQDVINQLSKQKQDVTNLLVDISGRYLTEEGTSINQCLREIIEKLDHVMYVVRDPQEKT